MRLPPPGMHSSMALSPSAPMHAVSSPCAFGPVLENGRARAIAEQHAGVAILPVDDGRQPFGTDDQHRVVGPRHDELLADFQRVDEAGAGGLDVECRRAARAQSSA